MSQIDDLGDFAQFTAVFSPARIDDLKPGAAELIGKRLRWSKGWIIEDGPYAHQWACPLIEDSGAWSAPFAWAPECDLTRIESGDGMGTELAPAVDTDADMSGPIETQSTER